MQHIILSTMNLNSKFKDRVIEARNKFQINKLTSRYKLKQSIKIDLPTMDSIYSIQKTSNQTISTIIVPRVEK
jgi:hypothetical protein